MTTFKAPRKAWVSPHDGEPVKCDTDANTLSDDHGDTIGLSEVTNTRFFNRLRKWLEDNFGAKK